MLNRHTCTKCRRAWVESDWDRWLCVAQIDSVGRIMEVLVDQVPPEVCPHKLEHAMAAGMTNAK